MILAAFLLAQSQAPAIDILGARSSVQTRKHYEAYVLCFAREAYNRRKSAGSAEAHVREAKAACRKEYDSVIEGVVKDSAGTPDAASAAINTRLVLDEMDVRILPVMGPPAPARLKNLPVEQLVGRWRSGGGQLGAEMDVHFTEDGALVGILTSDPDSLQAGLKSWKITSDGTKDATFHAFFANGKAADYQRIPSFPGELDFINAAEKSIQRFDLTIKDGDLILGMVAPGLGTQLRFRRQSAAEAAAKAN
jgi:hypothetical protein